MDGLEAPVGGLVDHHRGLYIGQGGATGELHRDLEVISHHSEQLLDASLAVGGQSPEGGAANEDCFGTQSEGLEYIAALHDAAIHHDHQIVAHSSDYLGQDFNCCRRCVQLSSAMVGDNDAVAAVIASQFRVFGCEDTLQNDGQMGELLQPLDVLPGDTGIVVAGHILIQPGATSDRDTAASHLALKVRQAQMRGQAELVACICASVPIDGRVNGHHQGLEIGSLSAMHQLLSNGAAEEQRRNS